MTRKDASFPDPLFLRIMRRLDGESEEVKGIFMHYLCQEMQENGLLELRGTCDEPGMGRVLLYKDPISGSIYEVVDPHVSIKDESSIRDNLKALLKEELKRN